MVKQPLPEAFLIRMRAHLGAVRRHEELRDALLDGFAAGLGIAPELVRVDLEAGQWWCEVPAPAATAVQVDDHDEDDEDDGDYASAPPPGSPPPPPDPPDTDAGPLRTRSDTCACVICERAREGRFA